MLTAVRTPRWRRPVRRHLRAGAQQGHVVARGAVRWRRHDAQRAVTRTVSRGEPRKSTRRSPRPWSTHGDTAGTRGWALVALGPPRQQARCGGPSGSSTPGDRRPREDAASMGTMTAARPPGYCRPRSAAPALLRGRVRVSSDRPLGRGIHLQALRDIPVALTADRSGKPDRMLFSLCVGVDKVPRPPYCLGRRPRGASAPVLSDRVPRPPRRSRPTTRPVTSSCGQFVGPHGDPLAMVVLLSEPSRSRVADRRSAVALGLPVLVARSRSGMSVCGRIC